MMEGFWEFKQALDPGIECPAMLGLRHVSRVD